MTDKTIETPVTQRETLPRPDPAEEAAARDTGALTDTLSTDTTSTSFGVFKPVGHVMVGLPLPGQLPSIHQ